MLRDEENNNHGYTASSYISSLEDGLLSIYITGQLSQQDNAHINTASIIQEWHEKHGIWVIDWPPCSPDLNNIEYVWRALKDELYQLHSNLHELKNNEAGVEIFQS